MIAALQLFALLLILHALADYPLQGDFLARAKNPSAPIPGVPWQQAMAAHCAIHAGMVWLATGSLLTACAEFGCHWVIDRAKCRGWIGFNADQSLHALCKAIYAVVLTAGTLA